MRVFVSSTVYDFQDLRSAIKYWLQEFGFEVLLSEQNDFPQRPDANSYESCLRVIESCQYFILLVGHRVGGWYDKDEGVSITRMEYRHAYQLSLSGRISILPFIRRSLWDIREDRNAIAKAIKQHAVNDSELSDIAFTPTRFVNDPKAIFEFMAEIGRQHEMRSATTAASSRPPGNWIYTFSSFDDVASALRATLSLSGNLSKKVIVANLKHEIEKNMSMLLVPHRGDLLPIAEWTTRARKMISGDSKSKSELSGDAMLSIELFLVCFSHLPSHLSTRSLDRAIDSGEFLEFKRPSGRLNVGSFQATLLKLAEEIDRLVRLRELILSDLSRIHRFNNGYGVKHRKEELFSVPNSMISSAIVMSNGLENLLRMMTSIYWAIERDREAIPEFPMTPITCFADIEEDRQKETATIEQTRNWLSEMSVKFEQAFKDV